MRNLWKDKRTIIAACGLVFFIGMINADKTEATSSFDTTATMRMLIPVDSTGAELPFVNDSLCRIEDPANSLSDFYNGLNELLNGKDTVINIVHLGDSHVQAGFLTGRTMRMLQNSFGNAGRGWIAPFKLTRTNEPNDYFISSNITRWTAGRCIQTKPGCPWGIGGIGIMTESQSIDFKLIIAPENGAGYGFNKVLMFRDFMASPLVPAKIITEAEMLIGEQPLENVVIDTFRTENLLDTLSLKSIGQRNGGGKNLYYGFMLSNGRPGLLYHSIGVNGAKYTDFTNRAYVRQLSLLNPSLLIVSLGTNESFGRNFSAETFEQQVEAFVGLIREELPGTAMLITTPAETYKRTYVKKKRYYVPNENMALVSDAIKACAAKEGLATIDFYSIAGGPNSCIQWYNSGLFGRDHIHFTRNGYDEQGKLLYKAIIRSYNHESLDLVAAYSRKEQP
ncbi:MAG: GDSL-type esterase/lipase family protein [Tannerella sp.]|nr:GDSL-type esterase/lipase family protein [Tannerella sp.]